MSLFKRNYWLFERWDINKPELGSRQIEAYKSFLGAEAGMKSKNVENIIGKYYIRNMKNGHISYY